MPHQPERPSTRPGRPHPRGRALLVLLVAAVLALAVVGCGGSSHHTAVASLPSSGGTHTQHALSSSSGVPDPDSRPREPLNATDAQQAALYDPYLACLRAHRYIDQQGNAAKLAVADKCLHLEPLAPWQLDPTNPQARAFIGRTVSCLQAKGYHAEAYLIANDQIEPPEWFVKYSPVALNYTPRRPVAAEDACHQQALK